MRKNDTPTQPSLFNLDKYPVQVMRASHKSTDKHSHDFYELVFVREGYCMHHLDDAVYLAMEGDLLLIKPGMRHRYTGTRECQIFNCLFTAQAFETSVLEELLTLPGMPQMLSCSKETFPHLHLDMQERKYINKLLSQMASEYDNQQTGWCLKTRSMLCEVMIACSRIYQAHEGKQSEKDYYSEYVTKALLYIDEHFADNCLTVQKVGVYTGISADYLSRQFRKLTGVAVQEYIRRFRLSRAISYLRQGYSVSDAAQLSGFHSISYFSREFKKELGVAPSHYEKL